MCVYIYNRIGRHRSHQPIIGIEPKAWSVALPNYRPKCDPVQRCHKFLNVLEKENLSTKHKLSHGHPYLTKKVI